MLQDGEPVCRAALVGGHDTFQRDRRIRDVGVDDVTAVQEIPQLLVEGDPLGELSQLLRCCARQVPLDPKVTPQGRPGAELQRVRPPGRVVDARSDMRAHQLRRQDQAGPANDPMPLMRVDAVGKPDAVGHLRDAEVDPSATTRARLDLEPRMAPPELGHEPVDREGLKVHGRLAAGLVTGVDKWSVVVPLDEPHAVLADDGGHLLENVAPSLRMGEVEDVLVARSDSWPVVGREQPLRVLTGQSRVVVDHLRFEPEAELHAQGPNPVHEGVEAVGPHLMVDDPVAKSCAVVASAFKPAVVKHEPLDSELCSHVGELQEPFEIVVEVHRLPGVEKHRTGRAWVPGSLPEVAVESAGQLVEALAPGTAEPRGHVVLVTLQHDLAGQDELTSSQEPPVRDGPLGEDGLVAAPSEVDSPDASAAKPEPLDACTEHCGGVVTRPTAPGLAQPDADVECPALRMTLMRVAAGHVQQFGRLRRHGKGGL